MRIYIHCYFEDGKRGLSIQDMSLDLKDIINITDTFITTYYDKSIQELSEMSDKKIMKMIPNDNGDFLYEIGNILCFDTDTKNMEEIFISKTDREDDKNNTFKAFSEIIDIAKKCNYIEDTYEFDRDEGSAEDEDESDYDDNVYSSKRRRQSSMKKSKKAKKDSPKSKRTRDDYEEYVENLFKDMTL
jgi:hypothetical protein